MRKLPPGFFFCRRANAPHGSIVFLRLIAEYGSTQQGSGTLRFRALDSWRGICALLVAAHHLEARGFIYWQPLVRNAWLFVDFFFVLSGFVIAHAYGANLSHGP